MKENPNYIKRNATELTQEQKKELIVVRDAYFNHLSSDANNNMTINDLNKAYPQTENIDILLEHVDDLKKCLDSFRPFDTIQLKNLEEHYDTLYTYESNRIEGNTLTLNETHFVINEGLTIGGKPLKDHLEAINHNKAYQHIKELANQTIKFNESDLLDIHAYILDGIDKVNAGRYRNTRVRISGSQFIFPNPMKVPDLMTDYFNWYEKNKTQLHPVLLAGEMHKRLVAIHPFIDGNGRTARLVMNLLLLQRGLPIINISADRNERFSYYETLEHAHMKSDKIPFLKFILNQEKKSLIEYLNIFSSNKDVKKKGYYFFKKMQTILEK